VKRIVLLMVLISLASGCHRIHDGIPGSGKLQKQKRDVGSFNSISTEGASGAGNIEVSGIRNEKFGIDASGAPAIRVAGETSVLDIDTSGAGKIDTHKLRAARVVVDSKGVSKVEVYATEQLDVTVSGPSHVIYEGEAVVNKTVNGPGTVEKKESGGA
jgi:hypothetical protein